VQAGTIGKKSLSWRICQGKIGQITIRDLCWALRTRLDGNNSSAKLLGHGDLRIMHSYKHGKDILREGY
jgi:hypothetical protein